MSLGVTLEKRVKVLMDFRGYKVLSREERKDGVYFVVETPRKKKLLLWGIPSSEAIGVRYINQMKKTIENMGLEGGVVISNGNYTQAARSLARKSKIELIPLISPAFNIFEHVLVPVHQILTHEEKEELLRKFRVKPYQLPRIKASDPVAKAMGAKPGDILRIIRNSPTAGKYISYRYVIEG